MNTRIRSLSVILIVLALSLAAVGPLSAGATKTYKASLKKVALLTLGPLTNVAEALQADPEIDR